MTDHKFTGDEIVELLKAYVERMCGKCNVKDLGTCCGTCFITPISQAADLINRQKAEIESLQAVHADMTESLRLAAEANKDMQAEIAEYQKHIDNDIIYVNRVKAEAIKEFAERLKQKGMPVTGGKGFEGVNVFASNILIDTLVKEMTEERK